MGVRSTIEIDVEDEGFKAFMDNFRAYQKLLKESPQQWSKTEEAIIAAGAAQAAFAQGVADNAKAEEDLRKEREKSEQIAEKSERDRERAIKRRIDAEKRATRETLNGLKSIGSAAIDLVKGIGGGVILSGLLGAGGLWGLDRLASRVGDNRKAAQGLGINSGQQQAFGLNFGRYVDANSNLESIASAKSNYADRWAFSAMGVNPVGKDPAQLAVEMALKAKDVFGKGDESEQYAQAHGLTQFYSMADLRRLDVTSRDELKGAAGGYRRDASRLALSEVTQRKWQDFTQGLDTAKQAIQNSLVDGLTPLAGPLKELSKSIAATLEAFLKNPHMKEWLEAFGKGIEQFGAYISSEKFQADVKQFVSDFSDVAHAIHEGLKKLGIIKNPEAEQKRAAIESYTSRGGRIGEAIRDVKDFVRGTPNRSHAMDFFLNKGWSKEQAAGIVANLEHESRLNTQASGDKGKAYGIAQWHKDRQDAFRRWSGKDIRLSTLDEQLAFVDYELRTGAEKAAGNSLRRTTTASEAGSVVSRQYERPRDTEGEARRRGSTANTILVSVNNNTGGNANVQANQAAH